MAKIRIKNRWNILYIRYYTKSTQLITYIRLYKQLY